MIDGGFCRATCGACALPQANPPTTTIAPPSFTIPSTTTATTAPSAQPIAECVDVQPPGNFTCVQQKAFGACSRPWMVTGGYCRNTCGACGGVPPETPVSTSVVNAAPPAEEQVAAAAAAALPELAAILAPTAEPTSTSLAAAVATPPPVSTTQPAPEAQRAPVPAAEQYMADLAAAAATLAVQAPVSEATVLPAIILPGVATAIPTAPEAGDPLPMPGPPPATAAEPSMPPAGGDASAAGTTSTNPFLDLTRRIATPSEEQNPVLATPPLAGAGASAGGGAPLAVALPPVAVPSAETQGPACNKTSALEVLRADPDLSTTFQAAEVLNLGNVLQDPNINFTVRNREMVMQLQDTHL